VLTLVGTAMNKLLVTGFEDVGKYSHVNSDVIKANLARNHQLAAQYGWNVFHMNEACGINGTGNFLSSVFPLAEKIRFSDSMGWAERSDFARLFAMVEKFADGYDVVAWLDADVFVLDPKSFFEKKYAEGLYAPQEPWFNQKNIESFEAFDKVKQEPASGVLVSSGQKGCEMLRLIIEIGKFVGTYDDVDKRPWAQFGPKMLTRMNNLDYTTINDGKGAQIREVVTGVNPSVGLLISNTISINKYIKNHGLNQLFMACKAKDCDFVNMTPSSVKDISYIYDKLITYSISVGTQE
jgi:hypothetical protein